MSNVGKGVHRRIVMEKEYVEAWEVEPKEVVTLPPSTLQGSQT
jgi:hypothetical protein